MQEQETLFDIFPDEKTGEIEQTDIESWKISFAKNEKKQFLIKLEFLLSVYKIDNYTDLLIKIIKKEYEKHKSRI
mgnify:FL=1|tara:strand:- start:1337 stop:1561 length:225 start_codon:yes stop_codon:yes gene_type:complete